MCSIVWSGVRQRYKCIRKLHVKGPVTTPSWLYHVAQYCNELDRIVGQIFDKKWPTHGSPLMGGPWVIYCDYPGENERNILSEPHIKYNKYQACPSVWLNFSKRLPNYKVFVLHNCLNKKRAMAHRGSCWDEIEKISILQKCYVVVIAQQDKQKYIAGTQPGSLFWSQISCSDLTAWQGTRMMHVVPAMATCPIRYKLNVSNKSSNSNILLT